MKYLSRIAILLILVSASEYVIGQSPDWTINPNDYEFNGNVTAVVYLGEDLVTTGILGAFVGETCRGFSDTMLVDGFPIVFPVMCYSNEASGETLTFRYYDPVSDLIYNVNETIGFIDNMIEGSFIVPLEFHITLNNPPVLAAIGNMSVCQYSELAFTASATDTDTPANILTFSLAGAPAGASINSSTGEFKWTPDESQTSGLFTFSVKVTDNGIPSLSDEEEITVTVKSVPSAAGPITGPVTFTQGTSGILYSVSAIPDATSYVWTYTGTGATINGNGSDNITVDFSALATGGQLKVKGNNSCGDGEESSLTLSTSSKSLNITLLLEGFYNGAGGLVKVRDCTDGENWFDKFSGTISDTLTIQIAQTTEPYPVLFSAHGVPVNTNGTVSLSNVPGTLTGSYYLIIKHRNHIETWSQIVSFAGQTINYNFTDAASKAWGNNMVLTGSYYSIYCGDTNNDEYVDGFDLAITFNLNKQGSYGYKLADITGDGFVDGFDLVKVFNNNKKGVGMNTPADPMNKKK